MDTKKTFEKFQKQRKKLLTVFAVFVTKTISGSVSNDWDYYIDAIFDDEFIYFKFEGDYDYDQMTISTSVELETFLKWCEENGY